MEQQPNVKSEEHLDEEQQKIFLLTSQAVSQGVSDCWACECVISSQSRAEVRCHIDRSEQNFPSK